MSESPFSLKHIFSTAAVALAIDLLLVFPISHTSIIGNAITALSGGVIVPPLDWFATDILGMTDPAGAYADATSEIITNTGENIGNPIEGINPEADIIDEFDDFSHNSEPLKFNDYIPGNNQRPLQMAA